MLSSILSKVLIVLYLSCLAVYNTDLLLNKQSVVIYIDFSKPSTEKRLVIKQNGREVYRTWVTHGSGSGRGVYTKTFSNAPNSHATSLGYYRAGNTYLGTHGLSRRLYGVSSTNSNAYSRQIVIHSASYIGHGRVGTSWGCFAVPVDALSTVLRYTQPGTLIIA